MAGTLVFDPQAADDVAYFFVTLIGSTLPGTNLSIVAY